jgi:hypothetical protein
LCELVNTLLSVSICQVYYPIGVNLLEYRDKILHANGNPLRLSGCEKCNVDDSIIIPLVV